MIRVHGGSEPMSGCRSAFRRRGTGIAAPPVVPHDNQAERGSGTVLAAGLALVVLLIAAMVMLLAQSAVLASRAASAADLAALAGADALRGLADGQPCAVAAAVAARHAAVVVSCVAGPGQTLEVRTQLDGSILGPASGHARAGPPPGGAP